MGFVSVEEIETRAKEQECQLWEAILHDDMTERQVDLSLIHIFFKEVTHFYCPACGGTRSVIALLHLDIERAFLCNPTVVYTGVMFLWCICLLYTSMESM